MPTYIALKRSDHDQDHYVDVGRVEAATHRGAYEKFTKQQPPGGQYVVAPFRPWKRDLERGES